MSATNLVYALLANTTYSFKFTVLFRSTSGTVGLKLGLTTPAFSVFAATAKIPIAGAGVGSELQGPISASGGSVVGTAVPAQNVDYIAIVEGVIRPSAGGNLQLQFAAETTGATVTLKAESVGELQTFS